MQVMDIADVDVGVGSTSMSDIDEDPAVALVDERGV